MLVFFALCSDMMVSLLIVKHNVCLCIARVSKCAKLFLSPSHVPVQYSVYSVSFLKSDICSSMVQVTCHVT